MTDGQLRAFEELKEIEKFGNGSFTIVGIQKPSEPAGVLCLDISLHTADLDHAPEGISLRARERFCVNIPADFPYKTPWVRTPHTRFAGGPHVQWERQLCIYQAPDVEWDPSDGMFGFVERLWKWLEKAAIDQLDPIGGPLHPPVAYLGAGPRYFVVPRVDTPVVGDVPWLGYAQINEVPQNGVEIGAWSDQGFPDSIQGIAACILLTQPMPWEFPSWVANLVMALESREVTKQDLFMLLGDIFLKNEENTPLYLIIGTPMRGIRGSGEPKQHLTAWRIEPDFATEFRLIVNKYSSNGKLKDLEKECERTMLKWARTAYISWCNVLEDRPEIVTRRDHASPLSIFRGQTVAIWGCGALGGSR